MEELGLASNFLFFIIEGHLIKLGCEAGLEDGPQGLEEVVVGGAGGGGVI